jgi:hypothetical protein
MSLKTEAERKSRRYLRKSDLLQRYGWTAKISIDRAVARGDIPAPIYIGNIPMWDEDKLNAHDDAQQKAV